MSTEATTGGSELEETTGGATEEATTGGTSRQHNPYADIPHGIVTLKPVLQNPPPVEDYQRDAEFSCPFPVASNLECSTADVVSSLHENQSDVCGTSQIDWLHMWSDQ